MKKKIFLLISLLFCFVENPLFAKEKPRLVVKVIVDGLRYDNFVRYSENYSNTGFKKLATEGTQFRNARHDGAIYYPFVGVASMVTGANASQHGIVGQKWINYTTNESVDMFNDYSCVGVGTLAERGAYSPNNINVETVGDLLRSKKDKSKVISIGHNYTNAIMAGGSNPTAVYWLDTNNMWLASSSYYIKILPKWLELFNRSKMLKALVNRGWEAQISREKYFNSDGDVVFENMWHSELVKFFENKKLDLFKLEGTPQYDDFLFEAAKQTIENENLGGDEISDMLTLSLSGLSHINRIFGIGSAESEDAYYNLDRNISELNNFLTNKLGKNKYVIIFTGSCGTSNDIKLTEQVKSGRFNRIKFKVMMNSFLTAQYGYNDMLLDYHNGNLYLNRKLIFDKKLDLGQIREKCATFSLQFGGVMNSYTSDVIRLLSASGGVQSRLANGFHPKYSGDVVLQLLPNWVEVGFVNSELVSSYGSAYDYDMHVPLIFFGVGIPSKDISEDVSIKDIAPTVGELLGVGRTDVCQGNMLDAIVKTSIIK